MFDKRNENLFASVDIFILLTSIEMNFTPLKLDCNVRGRF